MKFYFHSILTGQINEKPMKPNEAMVNTWKPHEVQLGEAMEGV